MKRSTFLILLITAVNYGLIAQCANNSNIYSFEYDSKTYEIIKENKSWVNAAACAVERGGMLTEINNLTEQNKIFSELGTNASITLTNTTAADGGDGSYVWIGGNDLTAEGNWVWNGNNDATSAQFWQGTASGSSVGGLYNNWGNEPDDFGSGQDALALSLDGWPLGDAGQWNDVDHSNTLYYVIEHSGILSTEDVELKSLEIYPNPAKNYILVENKNLFFKEAVILNGLGQQIQVIKFSNKTNLNIDLSAIKAGVYFIKIISKNGNTISKKFVK